MYKKNIIKILFISIALFINISLHADNAINEDDHGDELIIDFKKVFPYGVPKSIKGYILKESGEKNVFLDMEIRKLTALDKEDMCIKQTQELVDAICINRDTIFFYYRSFQDENIPIRKNFLEEFPHYKNVPRSINYHWNLNKQKWHINKKDKSQPTDKGVLLLDDNGFAICDVYDAKYLAHGVPYREGSGVMSFIYDNKNHLIHNWDVAGRTYANRNQGHHMLYSNTSSYDIIYGVNYHSNLIEMVSSEAGCGGYYGERHIYKYSDENDEELINDSGIMIPYLLPEYWRSNEYHLALYFAGMLGMPTSRLPKEEIIEVVSSIDCSQLVITKKCIYNYVFSELTDTDKNIPKHIEIDVTLEHDKSLLERFSNDEISYFYKEWDNMRPYKIIYDFEW